MKLSTLLENRMKRSDPYISGELEAPVHKPVEKKVVALKSAPVSAHQKRLMNFAEKAGVTVSQVRQIWSEETNAVDSRRADRWALVTARVKQRLGL